MKQYIKLILVSCGIWWHAVFAASVVTSDINIGQIDNDLSNLRICLSANYMCISCDFQDGTLTKHCHIHNISGSNVVNADLQNIKAQNGIFDKVNFALANADNANMQNASMLLVDLYEARFHGANLSGATIQPIQAFNTEFHNTNLSNAKLYGNVSQASFAGANLTNTNMSYANLRGAKFDGSTVFANTNVKGANFKGVNSTLVTYFFNANLVGMVGIPQLDNNIYWDGSTCPDGTLADNNGTVATCSGHFVAN